MSGTNHIHIQYDEMKRLSEIDLRKASMEEFQLLMEVDEKAHQCPVCRDRYNFFLDSAEILGWGKPAEMPLSARVKFEIEESLEYMRGAAKTACPEV